MNIFEIEQSLLELVEEVEANGGEITPELQEKFNISESNFKEKIKSYTEVIKQIKSDITLIKEEESRLKSLKQSKEKVIDRLSKIMVDAIDNFGDTSKSGSKFIDYGTGKVSIRKSEAVEVNDEVVKEVGVKFKSILDDLKSTEQLDLLDSISRDTIIANFIGNDHEPVINEKDLEDITATLKIKLPLSKCMEDDYEVIKTLCHTAYLDVETSISKTDMKAQLKEDGCCSSVARLVNNKSIVIK